MLKGFQDLEAQPEAKSLEHGEWLALLLDREMTLRRQKRFESRARAARLRHQASVEDVDFRVARGLDRRALPQARRLRLDPRPAWACSPGRPASARAGWPAPSATKPAGRISPSPTTVPPGCLPPRPGAR